jgi:hypothetical protein
MKRLHFFLQLYALFYDNFHIEWDKILAIDNIWFEIVVRYQYDADLEVSNKNLETLHKTLLKIEEKNLNLAEKINRMARKKALRGENGKWYNWTEKKFVFIAPEHCTDYNVFLVVMVDNTSIF